MNSHKQKPEVGHQNQVSGTFQTEVTILGFFSTLNLFLIVWNGQKKDNFGHSGQSEVPDNGSNGFPMVQNLGIDTKIKSLALSKPKLQIWSFSGILAFPYLIEIGGAVY